MVAWDPNGSRAKPCKSNHTEATVYSPGPAQTWYEYASWRNTRELFQTMPSGSASCSSTNKALTVYKGG